MDQFLGAVSKGGGANPLLTGHLEQDWKDPAREQITLEAPVLELELELELDEVRKANESARAGAGGCSLAEVRSYKCWYVWSDPWTLGGSRYQVQ